MREVKLNELETALADLDYPVTRQTLLDHCDDVVLLLADGTEDLSDIVSSSSEDIFESTDEVTNEVMSLLPQHAVGEPYQSEGEG